MLAPKYYYKLTLSYLGFRYFGWQKQLDSLLTVQGTLDKAIEKFHTGEKFKTLGASRTDAKVSAFGQVCKLTIDVDYDPYFLLSKINENLPQDIRILEIERSTKDFLVINGTKMKEYYYFFSNAPISNAFSAPMIVNLEEKLDIELMQKAARVFEGEHNFKNYVYKGNDDKQFVRTIHTCEILENKNFFQMAEASDSLLLRIKASGFMRHQVRIIMGTLFNVGLKKTTIENIKDSFNPEIKTKTGFISPAPGLFLKQIWY